MIQIIDINPLIIRLFSWLWDMLHSLYFCSIDQRSVYRVLCPPVQFRCNLLKCSLLVRFCFGCHVLTSGFIDIYLLISIRGGARFRLRTMRSSPFFKVQIDSDYSRTSSCRRGSCWWDLIRNIWVFCVGDCGFMLLMVWICMIWFVWESWVYSSRFKIYYDNFINYKGNCQENSMNLCFFWGVNYIREKV